MILPEESRMSRSVMIPIGNDKEIREHCWLKTLPIMQIENIRFRYILKRYALPQRALPMNAIAAFCISRQGNNSDFLHTTHGHIGPRRRVRLCQVKHLIESALRVINNVMPIKLQARILPWVSLYHQR